MVKRLKVSIGGHRSDLSISHVNDPSRPTVIDTPLFAGRVVVFVRDFVGIAPEGCAPIKDHPYFHGRSRKFAILIEGRFKQREGVPLYTGDEIQFGTDFDYLPSTFPRAPFNAGMSIAQYVDPATYYNERPPSGRPFIMSPFVACMNTFCAYPAPEALSRALVLAHHDSAHPHHEGEAHEDASFVPRETIERDDGGKKVERADVNYWRFVGLRGDPKVDAFLQSHQDLLEPSTASSASAARPGMRPRASTHLDLGTATGQAARSSKPTNTYKQPQRNSSGDDSMSKQPQDEDAALTAFLGASSNMQHDEQSESSSSASSIVDPSTSSSKDSTKPKKRGRFSLAGLMGALPGGNNSGGSAEPSLHAGDLTTADKLAGADATLANQSDPVEVALGPWRFGAADVDAIEDSTFIFLDPSHVRTVAQRRKHFVADGGKHRRSFTYDPHVVYAASFFTPFADLNTLDVKMGPVHINVAKYFADMPLRYTLRSTRLVPRLDGQPGEEEECFATIAFELVDVAE